jgi:dTDP-4-dehydrorhamnose reductase
VKNLHKKYRILVVGATGLIGSTIFNYLSKNEKFVVYGSIRDSAAKAFFRPDFSKFILVNSEASDFRKWNQIFEDIKPDMVINCLGITKHLEGGNNPLVVIPINSYFPHFLDLLCKRFGARFVHISSDCVFSGSKGGYLETDVADATDFYGRSKALGEINEGPGLTLRTSTIGHELNSAFGLLDWFLGEEGSCQGYRKAYFSGLPTIELAKIIENFVVPRPELCGLYHVGAKKISKFDLLVQIAREYGKKIEIIPSSVFTIDRSLNSDRFYKATGYKPPSWTQLIKEMHLSK